MPTYGDVYGATYGSGDGVSPGWPDVAVSIGTASASDAFILDDDPQGKLNTGGELGDALGFVWVDITDDVRAHDGITINRGSTRNQGPYFRYEAGSLSLSLGNRDGDYDPFNLSGPHVSAGVTQLRPGLPIRVQAVSNMITYTLFIGYVESWTVTYPESGIDSVVDVLAADGVAKLMAADSLASPSQGSGENAGTRIGRILDNVSWDEGARIIDVDTFDTMLPTEMAQPAWTEMLVTSDSVNGYLFCDHEGRIVFQPKNRFPREPDSCFGADYIPTTTVEVSNDADQLFNSVKLGRSEGVVQGGRDEDSIALFGLRGFARSDLTVNSDPQSSDSMTYVLSQFSDLLLRIEGLTVKPQTIWSSVLWQELFRLDVQRRVMATFTTTDGRDVAREGLVRGVGLIILPFAWTWSISTTQAPEALGTFTLDDMLLGELDTGTLAAF